MRNSANTPFGITLAALGWRPTVSTMRPASIGVAPPPWEKTQRMSGLLNTVPLTRMLVMVRVVSNGYSIACGGRPGCTALQQADVVGWV